MRKIEAVIKPAKLNEFKGYGRQPGHKEIYRGAGYVVEFVPQVKLEIALESALVEQAVETIRRAAGTGMIGDDEIFVLPLESGRTLFSGQRQQDTMIMR